MFSYLSNLSNNSAGNVIVILVLCLFLYLFVFQKGPKHGMGWINPKDSLTNLISLPVIGDPEASLENKQLLDPVMPASIVANKGHPLGVLPTVSTSSWDVDNSKGLFPKSPIMPHLNVIDGVSPFNPDLSGKEWASSVPTSVTRSSIDRDPMFIDPLVNRTDTDLATYKTANQLTSTPNMVPIPTMFPSPLNPNKVAITERFKTKDSFLYNQPLEVSLDKPINAQMSQWSQFGPCSTDNVQERTRTCIHGGISGGTPCEHTFENRKCA